MKAVIVTITGTVMIIGCLSVASAVDNKALTPKQEKVRACNAGAANKTGDERTAFLSDCLDAKPPASQINPARLTSSQDKVKRCNAEASANRLNGDQRQKFIAMCLRK